MCLLELRGFDIYCKYTQKYTKLGVDSKQDASDRYMNLVY